jgi:hypothetical protein
MESLLRLFGERGGGEAGGEDEGEDEDRIFGLAPL